MTRRRQPLRGGRGCPPYGVLLIDLALALLVIGLMAGLAIGTMANVLGVRKLDSETLILLRAKQAVLQFATRHGRLPCPDIKGAGEEGDGERCPKDASFGMLPVRALGLDMPVLPATDVLRYGVFRVAPDADLSLGSPAPVLSSGAGLLSLANAMVAALGDGQPYVPQADANGHQANCSIAGDAPAFVLSIGARAALGNGLCFPVPRSAQGALLAVGRNELAGWILSTFKSVGPESSSSTGLASPPPPPKEKP